MAVLKHNMKKNKRAKHNGGDDNEEWKIGSIDVSKKVVDKVKTTTSTDETSYNDIQIEMGMQRQLKIDYDVLVVADG